MKFRAIALIACLGVCVPLAAAEDWSTPARQLADKINSSAGPGSAMAITFNNASSLTPRDLADIRLALEAQLRTQGTRVVDPAQADVEVRITLAENLHGLLWVAEVPHGQTREVGMVEIPRAQRASPSGPGNAMTLRKTPLWSQDDPLLDVIPLEMNGSSGNAVLVLETQYVTLYTKQGSGWEALRRFPLERVTNQPRDGRGRMILTSLTDLSVYLPGVVCSGPVLPVLNLGCEATDDPWPLGAGAQSSLKAFFSRSRNFFNGVLSGGLGQGKTAPQFFSAARVEENSNELWLLDGTDGQVQYFSGLNMTPAEISGWGSDIAGIKTECGMGSQVLATRPGDWNSPDAVQAFEMVSRQAAPVSAPVEFGGPVTALWTAPGGSSAIAIDHNLTSGKYEAFSLSITCGR
ncbi:MAG TPA: hypothetical protein VE994_21480 [Terriglobales bacterium]|nr:hypothetical protein [Terriglobales bacterium]